MVVSAAHRKKQEEVKGENKKLIQSHTKEVVVHAATPYAAN